VEPAAVAAADACVVAPHGVTGRRRRGAEGVGDRIEWGIGDLVISLASISVVSVYLSDLKILAWGTMGWDGNDPADSTVGTGKNAGHLVLRVQLAFNFLVRWSKFRQ
jgi:hypothetical protein